MSQRPAKKVKQEIEYAAPPSSQCPLLAEKVRLMSELKEQQEALVDMLKPVADAVSDTKRSIAELRDALKAVNLELQLKKIRKEQSKLNKE